MLNDGKLRKSTRLAVKSGSDRGGRPCRFRPSREGRVSPHESGQGRNLRIRPKSRVVFVRNSGGSRTKHARTSFYHYANLTVSESTTSWYSPPAVSVLPIPRRSRPPTGPAIEVVLLRKRPAGVTESCGEVVPVVGIAFRPRIPPVDVTGFERAKTKRVHRDRASSRNKVIRRPAATPPISSATSAPPAVPILFFRNR